MVETSAHDVLGHFCTSGRTQSAYAAWERDPRRREVVPIVLGHRTRLIYELRPDDVTSVCHRTEHALGEVKRSDGEAVPEIVDWHPDFAFTHMFHLCMERTGQLPTYQAFRQFAEGDRLGKLMLGLPARNRVSELSERGVPEARSRAAMRWRVGNAYYSFLREVYTIVELREMGVDLRMHPLADALFRVDGWVGRTALSLRVANKKFREGAHHGRKTQTEQLLADVLPPVQFEAIELSPATKFGRVHLPSRAHLDRAAESLLREA
ncbi:hypothetical protein [Streptomyces sp. NPDC005283]|uniref:hypothetical protein n=1 Tax=Streptomyces sp. NPDC005283 TaxID=3156871 RepID=UPI0034545BC8